MMSADEIIQSLGGTNAVAKALGLTASVVSSWRTSNSIPRWRHDALISLSEGRYKPSDFPMKRQGAEARAA